MKKKETSSRIDKLLEIIEKQQETINKLMEKYEERIEKLEKENKLLRKKLQELTKQLKQGEKKEEETKKAKKKKEGKKEKEVEKEKEKEKSKKKEKEKSKEKKEREKGKKEKGEKEKEKEEREEEEFKGGDIGQEKKKCYAVYYLCEKECYDEKGRPIPIEECKKPPHLLGTFRTKRTAQQHMEIEQEKHPDCHYWLVETSVCPEEEKKLVEGLKEELQKTIKRPYYIIQYLCQNKCKDEKGNPIPLDQCDEFPEVWDIYRNEEVAKRTITQLEKEKKDCKFTLVEKELTYEEYKKIKEKAKGR